MKRVFGMALAGVAAMAAMPAQAAHYFGAYSSFGGAPAAATLSITTSDSLNAFGGFDVLALGGDVDGDTITGLSGVASTPGTAYSADGRFIYDNILFTSAPAVDYWGLLFTTASGTEYNLFSDSPTVFELYSAVGGNFSDHSLGTFTLATRNLPPLNATAGAVPETSTWAMMLVGFGAMGAILRRRRTSLTFA